jgi:hypothetical protein
MTRYVFAIDAESARRHSRFDPDLSFATEDEARNWIASNSEWLRQGFSLYAVEEGSTTARVLDIAADAAACLLLIIGGMWATGALSLWERLA